jgi:hypothetical protein
MNMGTLYLAASTKDATLCVDLTRSQIVEGARVYVWRCNGLVNQQWSTPSQGLLAPPSSPSPPARSSPPSPLAPPFPPTPPAQKQSVITIRTLLEKNLKTCLELAGGKVTNGSPVQIASCTGQDNQNFLFKDGLIHPKVDTRMCLDARAKMVNGSQLMLWECNGSLQQKFGYDMKMKTIYLAASQKDATLCLECRVAAAKVYVIGCTGHINQQWFVKSAAGLGRAMLLV